MVKRVNKPGANLVGAYCPSCGTMIFMQPGIKQCPSCKAFIGMDVWVEAEAPLEKETK
jgi:uncharacterized Zn finger protein (UPF0148 family)